MKNWPGLNILLWTFVIFFTMAAILLCIEETFKEPNPYNLYRGACQC